MEKCNKCDNPVMDDSSHLCESCALQLVPMDSSTSMSLTKSILRHDIARALTSHELDLDVEIAVLQSMLVRLLEQTTNDDSFRLNTGALMQLTEKLSGTKRTQLHMQQKQDNLIQRSTAVRFAASLADIVSEEINALSIPDRGVLLERIGDKFRGALTSLTNSET